MDLFVHGQAPRQGFVKQEQIRFEEFVESRFGRLYVPGSSGIELVN